MTFTRKINKVALAHIKDRKVIMVRSAKNDEVFYMLGGKIEKQESEKECLVREVLEEVGSSIRPGALVFLYEFEGPAHGKESTVVNIKLYKGELENKPVPSSEIAEVRYFDTSSDEKHLGVVSKEILRWLHANDHID